MIPKIYPAYIGLNAFHGLSPLIFITTLGEDVLLSLC